MYTRNNKTELLKTMDGLYFKKLTPKAVDVKKEASLLIGAEQ